MADSPRRSLTRLPDPMPDVLYFSPMKYIQVNGLKTAYYVAGKGERDILFIHGWAASGRMWLRSMWSLRHTYRTWALDLPGFGRSESPPIDWYTTEHYTDHVAAFCEATGIRPYAAIGHSMGGRIALDLARRYPHLAEKVIAASPTITGKLGFNLNILMAGGFGKALVRLSRHVWPLATAGVMSTYWTPRFLGSEGVKRSTDDLRRSSWQAAIGSLRAVASEDYSPYLPDISHPTLIICGQRDYTVPANDFRLAARSLPNARLVMLDQVHHWPADEAPHLFVETIQSFLAENGREGLRASNNE